ncbi:hypothetical protein N9A69_00415 [Gammaproteobacteria bacterium]|nr:hypothetical protein [Gammaproteobacteria bacterium]MDA7844028.1 hypothetical protein [Gammaproteobacteria bacterium]MDA9102327.1 hypothetical protein [Gammaproteobacteria bacterium]
MKHFALVSITVYLFYIFVYAAWAFIAFEILGDADIASYLYLPHGARVLMFCFFRWRSIPALIAAESTGYGLITISLLDIAQEPSIWWWQLSMLSSLLAVVLSVLLVKWAVGETGIATGLLKRISFANYKFLILVVFISALLNAVLTNYVISYFNTNLLVDSVRIFRYFIGDILGCLILITGLMTIFTTLKDSKLIIPGK